MKTEQTALHCRNCKSPLQYVFADLHTCPLPNAMVTKEGLQDAEATFPLKIFVCEHCFLVQVEEMTKTASIFNEQYTYFSSYIVSLLEHARLYVHMMINRFHFDPSSQVIEIASNDGYLLQYFKKQGIPVLGIEPSANTAAVAREKGIETLVDFFSSDLATNQLKQQGISADLIIGNNVLAHVPDIHDFVIGMRIALKPEGIITMEFPHLVRLIEEKQFDTLYHEHLSYLSFTVVKSIFEQQGLLIFDVEEIPINGGSLRVYARHANNTKLAINPAVDLLLLQEDAIGVNGLAYYDHFQEKIDHIKNTFLSFLLDAGKNDKKVIGYGAAAKGNTLLNYCGIQGNDLIRFVVDASPYKQGKYLPGSHIPVVAIDEIITYKPDYIIILPWNLKEEIMDVLGFTRLWGAKFVIAIPELSII